MRWENLTDEQVAEEKSGALFMSILHGVYTCWLPLALYMLCMGLKTMKTGPATLWFIGGYVFMVWIFYQLHVWPIKVYRK